MTIDPLVSVIIPTYKRAEHIPKAIESVRRQTHRNIEIVVVDDGSPDNTASVIQAIPESRIRYVRHDTNKGVSAARNTGINAATGEYIAFIDDDDEWREDKLEKQFQVITGYDAVLCMGVWKGFPMRVHTRSDISLDDLRAGSFNPSGLLAKIYVLRDVLFDETLKQGEDWDVFIRIRQRYSLGWMNEPLLFYNEGGHQRATNEKIYLSGNELEKRAEVLYKHREFFGEKWFRYHLADTLLAYIGSRPKKLSCVCYAVARAGFLPVVANIRNRVYKQARHLARNSARRVLHPASSDLADISK